LDWALFAISTGKSEFNDDLYLTPNKQDHQKQYLAAIASTYILLHTLYVAALECPAMFS
jgi:hypothetical protein